MNRIAVVSFVFSNTLGNRKKGSHMKFGNVEWIRVKQPNLN